MSDINVRVSTQKIFVDPASSSVAVVNAGPPGPGLGGIGPGGTPLPMYAEDPTELTFGNAWAMAAAPQILIPVAGDYLIQVGVRYVLAAAAGTTIHVAGGTSAEAAGTHSSFSTVGASPAALAPPPVKKTFIAGESAVVWVHGGAAGSKVGGRTITVTPL